MTKVRVFPKTTIMLLTPGAIKYFPISSQIKAYSTLVNLAPYLLLAVGGMLNTNKQLPLVLSRISHSYLGCY